MACAYSHGRAQCGSIRGDGRVTPPGFRIIRGQAAGSSARWDGFGGRSTQIVPNVRRPQLSWSAFVLRVESWKRETMAKRVLVAMLLVPTLMLLGPAAATAEVGVSFSLNLPFVGVAAGIGVPYYSGVGHVAPIYPAPAYAAGRIYVPAPVYGPRVVYRRGGIYAPRAAFVPPVPRYRGPYFHSGLVAGHRFRHW